MSVKYPKRLIEVDLPIKRISAHARREKSIRHGHISTLHIWWARRPLAACRAVICAALWPDPADPLCPPVFREAAEREMRAFAKAAVSDREVAEICDAEAWKRYGELAKRSSPMDLKTVPAGVAAVPATSGKKAAARKMTDQEVLRGLLLDFIADAAAWEASTNKVFLHTARNLTQAAHEALGGAPGTRPLVVDPFAGGGAIPLEALRVGGDAFASDINPVAVLLNKVVLEYIPKYGQRLADEVRKRGLWVKEQAEKELAEFYPKDPDGATPIAYLWARTIKCEGPGCGAQVPLIRSLWLSKKRTNLHILKLQGERSRKQVGIEIIANLSSGTVGAGTVSRGSATCPCCGYTTQASSIRKQLKSEQGGAETARLLCVVTTQEGEKGRRFRLPNQKDIAATRAARARLEELSKAHREPLSLVPDEQVNLLAHSVNRLPMYGMSTWGSAFTPRQALTLTTFTRLVRNCGGQFKLAGDPVFVEAVESVLALAVSRLADICNSLCPWSAGMQQAVHLFGRQAIPITWDFAETSPVSGASGDFSTTIGNMLRILERESRVEVVGHAEPASATEHPLPDDAAQLFVTDPPYYDAISYADLSDFFYVWLRRSLHDTLPDLFRAKETPKAKEIIVEPTPVADVGIKDQAFYLDNMGRAMAESRRFLQPSGVGVIVFAHKSTAGWEAQLQGMMQAGLVVTASWPIDTEREDKVSGIGQARLGSSIHLVCRPRVDPNGALRSSDVGDWRDVLAELPKRIHEWLPRLADEGVVGADAIFACLGPALEIFSRYSRVEKASGEQVLLREYLEQVWAAVSKEALNMIFSGGDATGFEEDARLTAMWLWTLAAPTGQETAGGEEETEDDGDEEGGAGGKKAAAGYSLEYDAARKIAQGLGAHLEKLAGMVEVKGDTARLLSVAERTKALFGKDQGEAPKGKAKAKKKAPLLPGIDPEGELAAAEAADGGWGEKSVSKVGETVLDRLHQTMILFAAGRGEALRRFLVDEGIGRDQRFWRLAQALSALYPAGTDEKRWVDGVLARKKGLGF